MASSTTWFLTLAYVSTLLVVSMDARSWDIAVTIGKKVDFFAQNGTLIGQSRVADAKILVGLAYDSVTRTLYMSDKENENVSMYSNSLAETESDAYAILKQTNGTQIMAVVFDPVNRTLFWTDGRHHAIMKMQVSSNRNPSPPEWLHDLGDYNPFGIALDICNRFVYWSSCKEPTVCRIERSKLDGSEREVIVNSNLYDVYGLAIDHSAGKLYWVDDLEGIAFNIERSNLNGTERLLFVEGRNHEPVYIAVDNDAVYWTDKQSEAIWKMKKNEGIRDKPVEFKSYYTTPLHSRIMSIIARDNIGEMDCDAILNEKRIRREIFSTAPEPLVKPYNYLPTRNIHLQCTCNSKGYWIPQANIHIG